MLIGSDLPWWPWKLIICVIGGILISAAKRAREGERVEIQIKIDKAAQRVPESLRDENSEDSGTSNKTRFQPSVGAPRFSLFLRPFSVTRRLSVENPYRSVGLLWPNAVRKRNMIDLETLLSDAFSLKAPLIGLGKSAEALGAGRIETSEELWQREVKKLAFAAESILVIPAISEGTSWEIGFLKRNDLLDKCIFVMPAPVSWSCE